MVDINLQLPENFLESEIRDGYLVSSEMKEIWAVQLDLLNEFIRVCKKYNLTYYADGGTLLGAVRHKGIIPWDDDIDVMMFRTDYEKLCKIAQEEFQHPYFFQTEYTDPGSLRSHAQLRNSNTTAILKSNLDKDFTFNQGIFLDIFVLDAVPDNEQLFDAQLSAIETLKRKTFDFASYTNRYEVTTSNKFKHIIKYVLHIVLSFYYKITKRPNKYFVKLQKEITKYNKSETQRVAKYFDIPMNKKRRVWNRNIFTSSVEIPFEMFNISVPIGYIELLDQFYGSWKEYKIGTATHGEVIFDTNTDYKEYLIKMRSNT